MLYSLSRYKIIVSVVYLITIPSEKLMHFPWGQDVGDIIMGIKTGEKKDGNKEEKEKPNSFLLKL